MGVNWPPEGEQGDKTRAVILKYRENSRAYVFMYPEEAPFDACASAFDRLAHLSNGKRVASSDEEVVISINGFHKVWKYELLNGKTEFDLLEQVMASLWNDNYLGHWVADTY